MVLEYNVFLVCLLNRRKSALIVRVREEEREREGEREREREYCFSNKFCEHNKSEDYLCSMDYFYWICSFNQVFKHNSYESFPQ
jgi:hypothetical protein